MAGATGSGQEMQTGRVNRAEGRTVLWAQVPPGQSNFNGPAIFIVEVAKDAVDPDDYEDTSTFVPSNLFHGIIATGHSGGGASNFGGTLGACGVIGRGGRNQGTGVFGLGGGTPEPGNGGAGGIGVHGLGGPQVDFFADPTIPPGAGVIGQGGRQTDNNNRERLPHAAGVIAIGGGIGLNKDLLPLHTLAETGGVGVYAQGAEQTVLMVPPIDETGTISGPHVPSGPLAPGAGVLGRGGVADPRADGPNAAGVIGLAGGNLIPNISETGNTGVYGAGLTGVCGQSDNGPGVRGIAQSGRGGMFESAHSAQVQLVPREVGELPSSVTVTPMAISTKREGSVRLPKDGQGGDLLTLIDNQKQCSLWFCVSGENGTGPARWAQVLLGPLFDGNL